MLALFRSPLLHTLFLAMLSGFAFWSLRAASFLGDGSALLLRAAYGQDEWWNHPLFLPTVRRFAASFGRTGLPLFDAMALASAVGAALFVGGAHRAACALKLEPGRAFGVGVLCATVPALATYATVVEVPGPMLAFVGPALWIWARAIAKPSLWWSLALGVATGLAHGMHGSAAFLPFGFAILGFVERRLANQDRPLGTTILHCVGTVGTHLATLFVAMRAAQPNFAFGQLWPKEVLVATQHVPFLAEWQRTLVTEWGVPFAPLCLAPVVALGLRTPALVRISLWVLALGGLAIHTWFLRASPTHGAYLIPLAFPLALWVARTLPIPIGFAVALAALFVSARNFEALQNRSPVGFTKAMVAEIVGDRSFTAIVGEPAEAVPLVRHAPRTPYLLMESFLRTYRGYDELCAAFRGLATGTELYVTSTAVEQLRGATDPVLVRFVREELDKQYRLLGDPRAKFRLLLVRRRS